MYCNRTRKQAHGPNQETHVCRPQPFITSMERRYLQTVSKREYIDCRKDRFCQREPAKTVWMHCDRGLGCGCHRTFQFQKKLVCRQKRLKCCSSSKSMTLQMLFLILERSVATTA